MDYTDAYWQGYNAFNGIVLLTNNPFDPGTQEHSDWNEGWLQGEHDWDEWSFEARTKEVVWA